MKPAAPFRIRVATWILGGLLLGLGAAAPVGAQGDGASDSPDAGDGEVLVPRQGEDPAPDVGLDDLLRLPEGFGAGVTERGGATRLEWSSRFETARTDVAEARKRLEQLNAELDRTSESSSSWQVSAPGASDPQTSPLSMRLREEIKTQRSAIEEAERRLRSLHVEADLASVPPEWRGGDATAP